MMLPGRRRTQGPSAHLTGWSLRRGWAALAVGLVMALGWLAPAQAEDLLDTNSPPEKANATLRLANRRICVFRATLDGYSPEERAAAATARLESVLARAKTMLVSTQAVPAGIRISLDGHPLFVLTPQDVSNVRGESLDTKAAEVSAALRRALHERSSLSTAEEVGLALVWALLGFVLFAALVWVARRGKRWLLAYSTRLAAEKTEKLQSRSLRTAGLRSFVALLRAGLNFAYYLYIAFWAYALLWYELRSFPYSRPWGDYLRSHCLEALASLGYSTLAALPELAVVVFIVLVARLLSQVISKVFSAVKRGEIHTRRLDPTTAVTTQRLLVFLVWVIAVVVAYPYIPGSQTLAFKGVTVFVGLVVSLGSTNIVTQIVSGLLLIYTRAFRAGDYVRVGESEGTVLGVGLCVTSIRTVQNEEVDIANSVLLGTATKNYSRLAKADGLLLPVQVTIGYNTPWRQVHAMLLEGARRTPGLAATPPPFVLQTALSDFYVEYQLNACLERPERRVWVQSDLHTHIQDVFNEHGVQIMSPHYLQDPPKPHIIPKANWFLPPATQENQPEDLARPSRPPHPSALQEGTGQPTTPKKDEIQSEGRNTGLPGFGR